MEKFSLEQSANVANTEVETPEDVFERISKNSLDFDKKASRTRTVSQEAIREGWQIREWKIGDTTIKALGVAHIPETFLEFRHEIEQTIQNSDVVINEFAPEAIGLYDKTSSAHLIVIKSRFNEKYNLEQIRQAYMKLEWFFGIGAFHHEIELLTAKYGKDMATADLTFQETPEALFQGSYIFDISMENAEQRINDLKKAGLYVGAAAIGITGLIGFIGELKKTMSRRKFLKLGMMAGGATIAGMTPKITETPQVTPQEIANQNLILSQNDSDRDKLQLLRDPQLADALQQLAKAGYKKIAFIYGTKHLQKVEEYLTAPEKAKQMLVANKEIIEQYNPNPLHIYRQLPGDNRSERFVASEKKVWKEVPIEKSFLR